MSALSPILREVHGGGLMWFCPGCQGAHLIHVGEGPGQRWGWNGNVMRPTFSPSVLVQTGRAVVPDFKPEPGDPPEVCHSFVVDGAMQFLGDCTHHLANRTVAIPAWPDR